MATQEDDQARVDGECCKARDRIYRVTQRGQFVRIGFAIDGNVAAYVAEAAIEWNQARCEANRLRALRSSLKCEHESPAEYDERGTCTYNGDPACWQATWQDQQGRDRHPSMDEWCEPCRQRQAAHVEYGKAVARRQGLMRGLQRRALTGSGLVSKKTTCLRGQDGADYA